MKRTLKIFAIIGVIVFVLCFTVLFARFCNSGFDFNKILPQTQTYESRMFEQKVEATSLVVSYNNQTVNIENSADDKVHVLYSASQDITLEFTTANNVFYIKEVDNRSIIEKIVSIDFTKQTIRIQLPSCFNNEIKLKGDNGGVSIIGQNVNDVYCKISNGKVKIADSVVNNAITAETNNGGMFFENVNANSVELETDNGKVVLTNCQIKGVDVETDNGEISVERLKSDDIKLQADNGRVWGSVLGIESEYTIFAVSHNGRSNLQNRVGTNNGKVLTAKTHNGSIDINFIES